MAETIKIEIPIEVQDNTDPALSDITERLNGMERAAKNAAKAMKQLSRGMTGTGQGTGRRRSRHTGQPESNRPSDPGGGRPTEQPESNRPSDPGGGSSPVDQPESNRPSERRGTGLWKTILEAKDMATPTISKVTSKLKSFEKKAWKTTFKVASAPIRKVAGAVTSPLMAAGASLSAGAMVGSSVKTFAGFESTMSQVKAVSGATEAQFEKLTAKAKEMGATTKFTAQEAGEAFNYMAMAGWKPRQMLGGISGIMNLAAASGEDLGTTSDIVTDALTAFGMQASDAGHFSDVLAQASSSANTTVSMMGETFKYVGTMAGSLKYSIEDVSLAAGLMANAGLKGSMAGTAMNTIFTRLATNTNGARSAIEDLGVGFYKSDGSARALSVVMGELREKTSGMTAEQKSAFASTVAGMEAQKGLLAILNASAEDWDKLSEAVNNADGASQRMADTMLDNLSGKFTLFQSALDGVKISLGERVSPYLVTALDWITAKMPDVESVLMRGMDTVDNFVDGAKDKISSFTSSSAWENADIFGKMHIAWDSLIGDSLADWWSGIEDTIHDKAAQIGTVIGEGLSGGLLTLLGIDIGEGINEGASIGASFAKGFARGFDLGDVLKATAGSGWSVLKDAAKILPGGESADISSLASTVAVLRTAVPVIGGIKNGVSLAKKIFGTETTTGGDGETIVTPGIGRRIIGSASQGTGLLGVGGRITTALGGPALSAGASSALGLGAAAGGVVGGITLISGGMDFAHAAKSEDDTEKVAYQNAGVLKWGGVGTGAAIGLAVGGPLGALIGAGIGGIAGSFAGNSQIKKYEEKKAADETMAAKGRYALEGARFETESLSEAFKDASVSADEFGMMMQEAVSQKVQDGFGNIKLSAREIQDAASQILFDGDDKGLSRYGEAASDAGAAMGRLQSAVGSMEKLDWKAGRGMLDNTEGIAQYQSGIQNVISGAQEYAEDQHYQATAAIDLLVEPGTPVDMRSGLNSMYAGIQEKLSSAGEQLRIKTSIALEDGVITLDEQSELSGLQQQITDITGQISDARSEAGMQSLKIKYSGAQLDYGSFAELTSELQSQMQESVSTYDDALEVSLTSLNMQLKSGAINQDQFDAQIQTLTAGYQAHIQDLSVNAEGFQLEAIADSFGSELDGILPDIKGTAAEKLGTAMHDAMAHGVDVEKWDVGTASEWLGLEGLSAETQSAVASMMSLVASTMPDSIVEALDQTEGADTGNFISNMLDGIEPEGIGMTVMGKIDEGLSSVDISGSGSGMQEGIQNALTASMENVDLSETAASLNSKLGEAMSDIDMSEGGEGAGAGLMEGIQTTLMASMENVDLSEAAASLNGKLGEAMSGLEMEETGGGLSEGIQSSISASLEGIDLSGVAESISASLNEALSGAEAMDFSGFGESLSASLSASVSGMDYSGVTSAVGSGISSAIEASMGTIQGAISNLYSQVGAAINSAFAAGFQTTTTVTITVNYQLANPTATISFSGGGTGTATVSASIASNAEGSIVNGRILSWVGEDGPEAIIPLGAKRRQRGLELWQEAGRRLGVYEYAEGGIVGGGGTLGGSSWSGALDEPGGRDGGAPAVFATGIPMDIGGVPAGDGSSSPEINISLSPTFEITSSDSTEVVQEIRAQLSEMAGELAALIAEGMQESFENMPTI